MLQGIKITQLRAINTDGQFWAVLFVGALWGAAIVAIFVVLPLIAARGRGSKF